MAYHYVLTTVSRKSVLAVSYNWNELRMVKYMIWLYLPLFTIIYLYLSYISHFRYYMTVSLFTLILLNISLFGHTFRYLATLTYKFISTPVDHITIIVVMYPHYVFLCWSSVPNWRAIGQLFWSNWIFKNGDTKSVVMNALECLSSRWNVITFSYWYSPWARGGDRYHQRGPHFNGTILFRNMNCNYFCLLDIPNR